MKRIAGSPFAMMGIPLLPPKSSGDSAGERELRRQLSGPEQEDDEVSHFMLFFRASFQRFMKILDQSYRGRTDCNILCMALAMSDSLTCCECIQHLCHGATAFS